MPRFERSGGRDSRGGSSRGGFSRGSSSRGSFSRGSSSRGGFDRDDRPPRRESRDFDDGPRGRRDSDRGPRRDIELTKVTCSSCGCACEVPFKPDTSKPVYCGDCFAKKGKKSYGGRDSSLDFEMINEKLDKIMAILGVK